MNAPSAASAASEAVARYGAIALGLAIGTAAKYGVGLNDGEKPTWRGLLADVLMLGMLGLIAVMAADVLSLTSLNAKVFVGALAALLSARLIKLVRERALTRAGAELDRLVSVTKAADAVTVPAGSGTPDAVSARVLPEGRAAATGAALRSVHSKPTRQPLPAEQQALLDQLKDS